jgi:ankyrin repeat protein
MKTKQIIIAAIVVLAGVSILIVRNIQRHMRCDLFSAAENNDLAGVKSAIEHGAQINQVNTRDFGFTPLGIAIYHENTNVAYYLIQCGADVNIADYRGKTMLMYAVAFGDEGAPLVRLLISHGARLNAADKDGGTVFDYLVSSASEISNILYEAKSNQSLTIHSH